MDIAKILDTPATELQDPADISKLQDALRVYITRPGNFEDKDRGSEADEVKRLEKKAALKAAKTLSKK